MLPATPPRWMTRSSTRKLTEIFCRCSGSRPSENLPGKPHQMVGRDRPGYRNGHEASPFNSLSRLDNITQPNGSARARPVALTCLPWLVRIRPNTAPGPVGPPARPSRPPRRPQPYPENPVGPAVYPGMLPPPIPYPKRRPWRAVLAALVVIAVVAAVVAAIVFITRADDDSTGGKLTNASPRPRSRTTWTRCSAAMSRRSRATRCAGCSTRSRNANPTSRWPT